MAEDKIYPISYKLTQKEVSLIEKCRALGYGQCTIFVEKGEPIRIVEVQKSIKL